MSWPLVSLGKFAIVQAGQSAPKKEYFESSGIPFIRAGSLEKLLSGCAENTLELLPYEVGKTLKMKVYPKDTIVFAKSGMSATLGRIYKLKCDCFVVSHLATICPDKTHICPSYLKYYFQAFSPANLINDPAYPSIRASDIQQLKVPLPPLPVQKQIAAVLEKADTLRSQCQQMEQELNSLAQSVFLDMFGDPVTNPKGWDVLPFSEFFSELRNGISPSTSGETIHKVLTLSAITREAFDISSCKEGTFIETPHHSKQLCSEDLLICRGNGNKALVGKATFPSGNHEDIVFPDTMIGARIDTSKIKKSYLQALWKTKLVRAHIESNARTTNGTFKINQKVISSIPIIYPNVELQEVFDFRIRKLEAMFSNFREQQDYSRELMNSLMQKAFKGELDLKDVA